MMKLIGPLGERGMVALVTSVGVLALIGGFVLHSEEKMNLLTQLSGKETKETRVDGVKLMLSRLAGYLVASNFIVCRSTAWPDGGSASAGACRWNSLNEHGHTSYEPSHFKLMQSTSDDGKLLLKVDVSGLWGEKWEGNLLTGENTWVKFSLKKISEINFTVPFKESAFNKDESVVLVEGSIEYNTLDKRVTRSSFSTVLRRPIGIPKINVETAACVQHCDTSLTEHPNPSCRSVFKFDPNAHTQINATTYNLGPGVIYDLSLARTIQAHNSSSTAISSNDVTNLNVGRVNKGFLLPGEEKDWSDNFPCAYAQGTRVGSSMDYLQNPLKEEFTLFPRAYAQTSTARNGIGWAVQEQHAAPMGNLQYEVNLTGRGFIEPARAHVSADITASIEYQGIEEITVIYSNPPH